MKKWQMLISVLLDNMIRQTHVLTNVKAFLSTQEERWEAPLGNQNANKKRHSEERVLEQKFLKNALKGCIKAI